MFRSFASQWVASVVIGIVSFFLNTYIARQLGPSYFGIFSAAMAGGALIGIFIDGGMKTLLVREQALASKNLEFNADEIISFALAHCCLILIGLLIISHFFVFLFDISLAVSTIACFFSSAVLQLLSATIRGRGHFYLDARIQLGSRLWTASAVVFVVSLGFVSPAYIVLTLAISGAAYLLFFKELRRLPRLVGLSAVYKHCAPFFFLDLTIAIYIRSDLIIMGFYGIDQSVVGQYAAAFRVCEGVISLVIPFGSIIFRYFRLGGGLLELNKIGVARIVLSVLAISFFPFALIFLFSDLMISIFYGDRYGSSGEFLRSLSFMLLFVVPNVILVQLAIALNKERVALIATLFVALFNLSLNLIFVPVFGVWISVLGKIISEFLICLLIGLFILRFYARKDKF